MDNTDFEQSPSQHPPSEYRSYQYPTSKHNTCQHLPPRHSSNEYQSFQYPTSEHGAFQYQSFQHQPFQPPSYQSISLPHNDHLPFPYSTIEHQPIEHRYLYKQHNERSPKKHSRSRHARKHYSTSLLSKRRKIEKTIKKKNIDWRRAKIGILCGSTAACLLMKCTSEYCKTKATFTTLCAYHPKCKNRFCARDHLSIDDHIQAQAKKVM